MLKKLIPILLLTATMLVGAFLGMMYRASNTELIELQDWSDVETIEPTKTPTPTPQYLPSRRTRVLINANPGFAGKLKKMYKSQWLYASELIARESSFNNQAINPTSGACGLAQALPCSKMKCELIDIDCQLRWIGEYVSNRYGTFKGAIAWHDLKKQECLDKQARGEISQGRVCAGWY